MVRYYDPHLNLYLRATTHGDIEGTPPEEMSVQELRRVFNLGRYELDELDDLLLEVENSITEWVSNHPPHE